MKRKRVSQSESFCFFISVVAMFGLVSFSHSHAQFVMKPTASYFQGFNLPDATGKNNGWHLFSSPVGSPLFTTPVHPPFPELPKSSFGAKLLKNGVSFSGVFNGNKQPVMNRFLLKPYISTDKITLPRAALIPSKSFTYPPNTMLLPSSDKFWFPEKYNEPIFGGIIRTIFFSHPGPYPVK